MLKSLILTLRRSRHGFKALTAAIVLLLLTGYFFSRRPNAASTPILRKGDPQEGTRPMAKDFIPPERANQRYENKKHVASMGKLQKKAVITEQNPLTPKSLRRGNDAQPTVVPKRNDGYAANNLATTTRSVKQQATKSKPTAPVAIQFEPVAASRKGGRIVVEYPSRHSKPRPAKRCFDVQFSQNKLDKTCSPESTPPMCRVEIIDHLNRSEFRQAKIFVPNGQMTLFVHPAWDLISALLLKTGVWEESMTRFMRATLRTMRNGGFLDVGSQVGVYTMNAAQMGRKVVAIDSNYQNTVRLRASVVENNFAKLVRVYWNALAEKSGTTMNLRLPQDCNVGGGGPVEKSNPDASESIEVRTARLDDIVLGEGCFSGVKELAIKADIEGNEWLLTSTGAGVFQRFNVSLVMMEWIGTQQHHGSQMAEMVAFFRSHQLAPYSLTGASTLVPLQLHAFKHWPRDVFWCRKELVARGD